MLASVIEHQFNGIVSTFLLSDNHSIVLYCVVFFGHGVWKPFIIKALRKTTWGVHEREAEKEFDDFFNQAPIALHWLSATEAGFFCKGNKWFEYFAMPVNLLTPPV